MKTIIDQVLRGITGVEKYSRRLPDKKALIGKTQEG